MDKVFKVTATKKIENKAYSIITLHLQIKRYLRSLFKLSIFGVNSNCLKAWDFKQVKSFFDMISIQLFNIVEQ